VAFETRRAELAAEIAELQRLQMEAGKAAVFSGWTREAEDAYEMRVARIPALRRELDVFGEAA
jgi:hypothetical protein